MHLILTDDELAKAISLHSLAFEAADFTPEAVQSFQRNLRSRNVPLTYINEWRRRFLRSGSADTVCTKCDLEVSLDIQDLAAGEYECPDCHCRQTIHYSQLDPPVYDHRLMDRLTSESDVGEQASAPSSTDTPELIRALATAAVEDPELRARVVCRLLLRGAFDGTGEFNKQFEKAVDEQAEDFGLQREIPKDTKEVETPVVLEPLPDPEVGTMATESILEVLAFRPRDFSSRATSAMKRELLDRGFTLDDIKRWRDGDTGQKKIAKPGWFWVRQITTLILVIVAIDTLMIMKQMPGADLIHAYWPDSRLGNGDPTAVKSVLLSLALFKSIVFVLLSAVALAWFLSSYKNTRESDDLKKPYRPVALGWGFMPPLVSYYVYYVAARFMLLANAVVPDTAEPPVMGESRRGFSTFWELALLTANPPLIAGWGLLTLGSVSTLANRGEEIITSENTWWLLIGVELLVCLGILCFTRVVMRGQERVYAVEMESAVKMDKLAELGRG